MKKLYKFCGLEEPEVILVDSPMACQLKINELMGNEKPVFESFSSYINAGDISWLAFYEFFFDNFDILDEFRDNYNLIVS